MVKCSKNGNPNENNRSTKGHKKLQIKSYVVLRTKLTTSQYVDNQPIALEYWEQVFPEISKQINDY